MKAIRNQVQAMRRGWPGFELGEDTADRAVWFGALAGIERSYRIMIEYGLPTPNAPASLWWRFPVVRVLSPRLKPNFDAAEEAPLPHVYFVDSDITLSPLCLFDVEAGEWTNDDLIADTRFRGLPTGWLVTKAGGPPADGLAAAAMPQDPRKKCHELRAAAPFRRNDPARTMGGIMTHDEAMTVLYFAELEKIAKKDF